MGEPCVGRGNSGKLNNLIFHVTIWASLCKSVQYSCTLYTNHNHYASVPLTIWPASFKRLLIKEVIGGRLLWRELKLGQWGHRWLLTCTLLLISKYASCWLQYIWAYISGSFIPVPEFDAFGHNLSRRGNTMAIKDSLYHSARLIFLLSLATTQLIFFGVPCINRFTSSGIGEEKIFESHRALKPPCVTLCPFHHNQQ